MWFMKMKNSEKMDPNINFAVICNKQDLFLIIPIYNEKKRHQRSFGILQEKLLRTCRIC